MHKYKTEKSQKTKTFFNDYYNETFSKMGRREKPIVDYYK